MRLMCLQMEQLMAKNAAFPQYLNSKKSNNILCWIFHKKNQMPLLRHDRLWSKISVFIWLIFITQWKINCKVSCRSVIGYWTRHVTFKSALRKRNIKRESETYRYQEEKNLSISMIFVTGFRYSRSVFLSQDPNVVDVRYRYIRVLKIHICITQRAYMKRRWLPSSSWALPFLQRPQKPWLKRIRYITGSKRVKDREARPLQGPVSTSSAAGTGTGSHE